MPFASEEAVVMLFSVAKETEPWTPQAGGRGGKDFISLLSLLCNFDLWSVTVNGLGLRVSLWSSLSKSCVLPPYVCFHVEINVKAGAWWHSSTLVLIRLGRWLYARRSLAQLLYVAEWNGVLRVQLVMEGYCTSLALPVSSRESPRPSHVSPIFKHENRNVKVNCRCKKEASYADTGAS